MDVTQWAGAFATALQPQNLLYLVLGTVFGLFVGALPGLGPLFGVSLMLPITFYMEPATAIIFLVSIHAATTYGDSWASILINAPGGVGSVATAWDGYQLASMGRSGYALGIATMASLLGGLIGWLGLILISPMLIELSLKIGPAEYVIVGLMALSLLSVAAAGETVKGIILGALGLLISFIGRDPVTATARFTFGSIYLEDGIRLVGAVLGLFALSEAFIMAEQGGQVSQVRKVTGTLWQGMLAVFRYPISIIRAGVIGVVVGVMPALGLSTANIVCYFIEKRSSKEPEKFGTGHVPGVLAPEVGNNACIVSDLIPTFTLGIPGSSTTALLMAALMIHGVQPGPEMFATGGIGYTVFAGVLLAQFSFFVLGVLSIKAVMKVVLVPYAVLVPMIAALTAIGTYADRNRLSDLIVLISFGIIGYILKKYRWPAACLVLGLVLGEIIEKNFLRAMLISNYDLTTFFTRPISQILILIMIAFLLSPYFGPLYRKLTGRSKAA